MSSEEYFRRRFASQDSDANADAKVGKQDPTFQDVSDSLLKLSLSKKRGNARLSKQRYASESSIDPSSEDVEHRRMRKETHSRIGSKLKLKNRKKK